MPIGPEEIAGMIDEPEGDSIGAKLITTKMEANPENPDAVCWFAYFDGTPSEDDLMAAFRSIGYQGDPSTAAYEPDEVADAVSNAAGLQRWVICQAV